MLLGYARVSKGHDQTSALQRRALAEAGVERVFDEAASGGRWDRPALHRLLDQLRPGDVVVVWKLDRLSRSLKDLLANLERVDAAGAGFRSLTEAVDTTAPAGRMLMQMLGVFAEFERAMLRERASAVLAAGRAEGRVGGRRAKLTPAQQADVVEQSGFRDGDGGGDGADGLDVPPRFTSRRGARAGRDHALHGAARHPGRLRPQQRRRHPPLADQRGRGLPGNRGAINAPLVASRYVVVTDVIGIAVFAVDPATQRVAWYVLRWRAGGFGSANGGAYCGGSYFLEDQRLDRLDAASGKRTGDVSSGVYAVFTSDVVSEGASVYFTGGDGTYAVRCQ